jgi:3-oxoacyl-[acyl-carrier-protein] synthase-3
MPESVRTIIAGSGSYIPERRITNDHFLGNEFYDADGERIPRESREIIEKFEAITGIHERRYVTAEQTTSDIGTEAARSALESSSVDPESLDCIIVAHNFGDVLTEGGPTDMVPSLASRVKEKLGIKNPEVVSYDLPFGCPGWLEGVIHAHAFIQVGRIRRALVVGAETLSRVLDPHDRDSMIYADGAGACVIEGVEAPDDVGVLSHRTRTDTERHAYSLKMGPSYVKSHAPASLFLKMQGHRVYEYAVRTVPGVILKCVEQAGGAAGEIARRRHYRPRFQAPGIGCAPRGDHAHDHRVAGKQLGGDAPDPARPRFQGASRGTRDELRGHHRPCLGRGGDERERHGVPPALTGRAPTTAGKPLVPHGRIG